jgi:hypothetical protein
MPPARKRLSFDRRKREAPWLAEYLRELTLFPAGRRDDQVDATARRSPGSKAARAHGMAEHWRRMAEEEIGGCGGGEACPLARKRQWAARWGGPARLGKR